MFRLSGDIANYRTEPGRSRAVPSYIFSFSSSPVTQGLPDSPEHASFAMGPSHANFSVFSSAPNYELWIPPSRPRE